MLMLTGVRSHAVDHTRACPHATLQARRIEVVTGDGMRLVIPDEALNTILQSDVVPRFKGGSYGEGLVSLFRTLDRAIRSPVRRSDQQ